MSASEKNNVNRQLMLSEGERMSGERKINPVNDNADKAMTYRELMGKYKKAVKSECYFEAMLISYAFLEDRLRSYLYYIGVFRTKDSYKFDNKKIKPYIKAMVEKYSENTKLNVSSISAKMNIVRSVQLWYKDGCRNDDNSLYLSELAECIDVCGDADEMLDILNRISEWCEYRNEVVHAVLNKNLNSLYSELRDRVEDGMALGRMIDKQISAMKRRDNVRKALKLK